MENYTEDLYARLGDFPLVSGDLMDRSLATHQGRERSAQLAYRKANDEGGLDGEVGLILCTIEENVDFDGLSRREAAVAAAEWLADEIGVPAIVGPAASGDTQAVFEAVRDRDVIVVSPSATSPALTALDETSPTDAMPGRLWRTAPPDSFQGATLAADVAARAVTRVAVVVESGAYGEGLFEVFGDAFRADGGTIVGTPFLFDSGNESQRDEQIINAGATDAVEVLFISSQTTDAVAMLQIANSTSGFDTKSILLTDSAGTSEVAMAAPAALRGRIRGTRPAPIAGPVFDVFRGAYAAANMGQSPDEFTFTAQAYDAAWLTLMGAAHAFETEGTIGGELVAQGIRRLNAGASTNLVPSNWAGAKAAFRRGDTIDVVGASGPLDYDLATEEIEAAIEVWGILECMAENAIRTTADPGGTLTCD